MMKGCLSICFVLLLVCCGGQGDDGSGARTSGRPDVYTTFYPTSYFTQRIAGDLVQVVCPVPEDEDAIFWQPPDEVVAAYQKADMIIVNGAEFEKWVLTASLPDSKVVDTAKSFRDEYVTFENAVKHSHGPAGEHAHEGTDGHTWVDPVNAKAQAREIYGALVRLLPDNKPELQKRYSALATDLNGLNDALLALKADYSGQAIYASHPAYNYLAKRYGLSIVNLDLDPEEMPDNETLEHIRGMLVTTPARHILWEAEPKAEIATRFLAELGLTSVVFSPCELLGVADIEAGEDYLTVMKRNIESLKPVLR